MLYSSVGFIALIIHLIINHDILIKDPSKEYVPVQRSYRAFLCILAVFYISDILWGVLYDYGSTAVVYLDTVVYFVAMAGSILYWTRYAVAYLQERNNAFGKTLITVGWVIFVFQMVMLALNFLGPVVFYFDQDGAYHAAKARYITLIAQILMFVVTGIHVLTESRTAQGTLKTRYRAIGSFSASMGGFVLLQTFFPLWPLYTVGCTLGCCVLHSFVLETEKEDYRKSLETQLRENLEKGNYYDLLTGLPGMTYFFSLADAKRGDYRKEGKTPAFIHADLSGMKLYNLKHGFSGGDRILQSFSRLLVDEFGANSCSRFGQDHFAVITEEAGLKQEIQHLFDEWASMGDDDQPGIRVGVYIDNMDEVDVAAACDRAKAAHDMLRDSYISSVYYFDNEIIIDAERRRYIVSNLDRAINEEWINVFYQPIVRVFNGRVCGEEALARWNDPKRGLLSPDSFIPALEHAGVIYKLDLYVLEQVLEKLNLLRKKGFYLVPQSVNLSRIDFDACDMVDEITKRVDAAGIDHRYISIEITESTLGSDFEFIKKQIDRFRALGFPVWMDDFGSGYSSLDLLSKIDIDLIKFDMHFIQQSGTGEKNRIVINELIKLAMALGIDTLCEGVETKEQADFLRYSGCAKLQGYYYTPPIPLEKILERYEKGIQIGFEDPLESGYYEIIGKINLYDLSVITREDSDSLRNYFNTIPMAVLEVNGDQARFTRSNQAYRRFMQGVFGVDIAELGDRYGTTEAGPGLPFVKMLRTCCENDGRALFDEVMPDGTTVHSYMRRVAENPANGTIAVAVAVLAIRPVSDKQ